MMFAEDIGALVICYSLQFDLNFIAQALLDNHCSDSYRHTAIRAEFRKCVADLQFLEYVFCSSSLCGHLSYMSDG